MKVQKKSTTNRNWLKAGEDIKDGDTVRILTAGEMDSSGDYGERQVHKIRIKRTKKDGDLSFNQTTINNLIDVFGDDTEKWVGQIANAFVVKAMIGGKMRNVCYLAAEGWTMDEEGRFVSENGESSEDHESGEEDINPSDIPF